MSNVESITKGSNRAWIANKLRELADQIEWHNDTNEGLSDLVVVGVRRDSCIWELVAGVGKDRKLITLIGGLEAAKHRILREVMTQEKAPAVDE